MNTLATTFLLAQTETVPATKPGAEWWVNLAYLLAAALFIFGLKRMNSPKTALQGNRIGAVGMAIAVIVTLLAFDILHWWQIVLGLVIGTAIGAWWSVAVQMTAMPQLVAMFNGFGGLASALVALADYGAQPVAVNAITGTAVGLSVLIGMVTLTGSVVAWAKLDGKISGAPVMLPGGAVTFTLSVLIAAALVYFFARTGDSNTILVILFLVSSVLGVILTMPIGGADMPVVISLLNSYSGLAAAMTGFVLDNQALIISGSLVGAAGLILTNIMCKGMNRSLANVLFAGVGTADSGPGSTVAKEGVSIREISAEDAAVVMQNSRLVIVIPGYGMAVAQAQHVVRELGELLGKGGVVVKYAIHPVAGRMPGHMNVLLAEANVPYPQLCDLDDVNPEFDRCDVALVIGANDVVNPTIDMPILNAYKAKTVIVSKRSLNPGFAGVDNDLFGMPNTYMLFGDAAKKMSEVVSALKAG